jgi:hypothetical protein
MAHIIVKTCIHKKDDLAEFALRGYEKEFSYNNYPRLFLGIDPYGLMRVFNIDAEWGPAMLFHEEDGPREYFRQYVMKGLLHTAVVGFPTQTGLILFVQDMVGCDRYFSTLADKKLYVLSIERDIHLTSPVETSLYDLYTRSPKFAAPAEISLPTQMQNTK